MFDYSVDLSVFVRLLHQVHFHPKDNDDKLYCYHATVGFNLENENPSDDCISLEIYYGYRHSLDEPFEFDDTPVAVLCNRHKKPIHFLSEGLARLHLAELMYFVSREFEG